MNLKRIYQKIEVESLSISVKEFEGLDALSIDLDNCFVAYTGKHKAFLHYSGMELSENDFDPHLLLECRLFNIDEEIFIYPRMGIIYQRIIGTGSEERAYIEKEIQLRNEKGDSGKNFKLKLRHYLDDKGGYSITRYLKLIQPK